MCLKTIQANERAITALRENTGVTPVSKKEAYNKSNVTPIKKQLQKLLFFGTDRYVFCYLPLSFVQPLYQLAFSPEGAIPPIKSTFTINGWAFKIGSSK